jgi:hypothetical protein
MDVNLTTSTPSNSSMDLMKMIDDANRATTVPETEQWTIRGWPKGLALFHKNKCQCCNNYVAHTIQACKEQGMNLPTQAVGDTVTKVWLMLMRDLEDEARERALETYKDLADDANCLRVELKASEAVLTNERSRVGRRYETICDLRDEIAALKRPPQQCRRRCRRHDPLRSHHAPPGGHHTRWLPCRYEPTQGSWPGEQTRG